MKHAADDEPRCTQHEEVLSSHCSFEDGRVGPWIVERKLGKGRCACVWACHSADEGAVSSCTNAAVKVFRAGTEHHRYYINEVMMLNAIMALDGRTNVIEYKGAWVHIGWVQRAGEPRRPRIHPCIAFGRAGEPLSDVLKRRSGAPGGTVCPFTLDEVRAIARQVFAGLAFLHAAEIIHTDIKPHNLLIDETGKVTIIDFGTATFARRLFSRHIGTTYYLAPELVLYMPYGTPIDIFAAYLTCYELITGDPLMDVYGTCSFRYEDDLDAEIGGLHVDDTHETSGSSSGIHETSSSDSTGSGSSTEEDSSRLIMLILLKVLGRPPKAFRKLSKYHTNAGNVKGGPTITPITLADLIEANYPIARADCEAIQEFLLCGLKYMPEARATAAQTLQHSWLQCS